MIGVSCVQKVYLLQPIASDEVEWLYPGEVHPDFGYVFKSPQGELGTVGEIEGSRGVIIMPPLVRKKGLDARAVDEWSEEFPFGWKYVVTFNTKEHKLMDTATLKLLTVHPIENHKV